MRRFKIFVYKFVIHTQYLKKVKNWLQEDPNWFTLAPESQEDRYALFKEAYIKQTRLRTEAEAKLTRFVDNRYDFPFVLSVSINSKDLIVYA